MALIYIFKVTKFLEISNILYLENGESDQKMLNYDFIEVDIRFRMA